ncbi:hypothetical protein D9M71_625370 [compost metagenome]
MPTGRRPRLAGVARHGLVAGVVEEVLVARVGRLHRRHAALETGTLALQPGQLIAAAFAEIPQGVSGNGIADFLAQVVEHGLGRILDAGSSLLWRTATGIDNAAAARRGATPGKALQRQHRGALATRFQGCADTRAAETDHQQVGAVIPLHLRGIRYPEGCFRMLLHCRHGAPSAGCGQG